MISWDALFSERAKTMKASAIRELLKLVTQPDIISFGGGLPDPHFFPIHQLQECVHDVLETNSAIALQYGATEGVPALRSWLAEDARSKGLDVTVENVVVTASSQQALDLIAKVMLDPGDIALVEGPSYLGALQAFAAFQGQAIAIDMDEQGIRTDILEERIKAIRSGTRPIKFIYAVPSFQNPAGITMSIERRRQLLDISQRYNIPIVEDHPYHALRYEGTRVPSIASLDADGHVIYLETFSKILSPGFRLGWVVAPEPFTRKLALAKQATDLCSSPFNQLIVLEFCKRGYLEPHVAHIRREYAKKRDAMLNAMDEFFPKEVKWTRPEGGMFLWVELPKGIDTTEMLRDALEVKVAYVGGTGFYPDGRGENCMRLNFSYSTPEINREGIRRLSECIRKRL
ncbi:MAG: PLP-dependent aminotransferase family protein [Coprothermobacterota bacterium]|nr:PLP-dependent aminotransferase family protein [Coprothermobacterota bacterium]